MWLRAMLRCWRRLPTVNPPSGALKAALGGGRPEDASEGDQKAYHWSCPKGTWFRFSALR